MFRKVVRQMLLVIQIPCELQVDVDDRLTLFVYFLGAAGGMLVGGYLLKRYHWKCNQILKAASIMAFISTVCVLCTLIGCSGRSIAGTDALYFNS